MAKRIDMGGMPITGRDYPPDPRERTWTDKDVHYRKGPQKRAPKPRRRSR